MANGAVVVDRWALRLVGTVEERGDLRLVVNEIGGELALARWRDGSMWTASLGTLRVNAVTADGAPARGVSVQLVDTDYRGITDTTGSVLLRNLLPGPYTIAVMNPQLAAPGLELATPQPLVAARGTVSRATVKVSTLDDLLRRRCRADEPPGAAVVMARAATPDGKPVTGARFTLEKELAGQWSTVSRAESGPDGLMQFCGLDRGDRVRIRADAEEMLGSSSSRTLNDVATLIELVLTPRR
jgi:hypothetical protein